MIYFEEQWQNRTIIWTIPVVDREYIPRRSDTGGSIRVNIDVIFLWY